MRPYLITIGPKDKPRLSFEVMAESADACWRRLSNLLESPLERFDAHLIDTPSLEHAIDERPARNCASL
jgi:hypothetical protein